MASHPNDGLFIVAAVRTSNPELFLAAKERREYFHFNFTDARTEGAC
jgi:hypothetical protein